MAHDEFNIISGMCFFFNLSHLTNKSSRIYSFVLMMKLTYR